MLNLPYSHSSGTKAPAVCRQQMNDDDPPPDPSDLKLQEEIDLLRSQVHESWDNVVLAKVGTVDLRQSVEETKQQLGETYSRLHRQKT